MRKISLSSHSKKSKSKASAYKNEYRELFNNINSGVVVYSAVKNGNDFIIKDFNKAAEKIEKIKKEKIIGKSVKKVFPGVTKLGLFDVFKKVWETGIPKHHPVSLYKDKRLTGWRENYVYKLPSGEIVAVYEDRTKEKKREEALARSEMELRLLLERANEGIWTIDKNATVTFVNPKICEMLGYKDKEMMGKSLFAFFDKNDIPVIKHNLEQRKMGNSDQHEQAFIQKNKNKIYTFISSFPIITEGGKYNGSVAFVTDITERKKLMEQLINSEKLSAVGQLTAGVAHEFNNILAVIKGNIELLDMKLKNLNNPDLLEILDTLDRRVTQGVNIINNMLVFAAPKTMTKEPCDILAVIDDIIKFQKHPFELEHIKIIKNYPDLPAVSGSKLFVEMACTQIEQVFLNLLLNARHALKPKGKGEIVITIADKGAYVEAQFSDNGIGMDEETRSKIFTPFFTTKGAMAKDDMGIKGTGLGLSVSFTIIKQHNGTICVESEQGKGTKFIITLPKIDINSGKGRVVTADNTSEIKINFFNFKILVVDDEKDITDYMSKVLNDLCKEVKCVNTGYDAINLIKNESFDVVFLDILLPDMGGLEIFDELKKIIPNLKVVLMSGGVNHDEEVYKQKGVYHYIQKPFKLTDIKNILFELSNTR